MPKKISLREFKTLIPYLKQYRKRYILGFLCLVIVDVAQMVIPQFMRRAIDLISLGDFEWKEVIIIAISMIGIMAVIALGRFLWRYFIHGSSRRIEAQMRERLFSHLITLSYDFYQKNKIGDLMARSTNDLNSVRESIGMGLVALIDGIVLTISILIIIFLQDARTALLAIIPLPLITFIILFFGSAIGKRFLKYLEAYSKMSEVVQETFSGIRVVKSFVKEWYFIKKFSDTNDDYRNANMELVKLYGVFYPFISLLSGLTSIIVLMVGGIRVIEGQISPGDMVALFRYLQMLIWPLMGAGYVVHIIQQGAASLKRINEVLHTNPAIASPENPLPPQKTEDVIAIRNLNFSYPEGQHILENINLTIKQGEWIGILGRTGSGKSTLVKTFMRIVDPPENSVFVKGLEIKSWNLEALRKCFGVTPQDSYLFSDTIKNNIAYGLKEMENINEDSLIRAVNVSALDNDLKNFSNGLDTVIGERGLTLSGGQKQRTAIARSIISDPEILILDDSLSAVDAETEKRILTSLLEERKCKTTIIISHRISTLRNADKIIVLDKGKISEYGEPKTLIKQGGFYAQMSDLQEAVVLEKGKDNG